MTVLRGNRFREIDHNRRDRTRIGERAQVDMIRHDKEQAIIQAALLIPTLKLVNYY